MACDLEPTCHFHFRIFSCTLSEDMIDVDIKVCTLKAIHTFRKDRNTQISRCSPWGMEVKLFLSLCKKIKDYIKECQAIVNPFTHRSPPSRPNPSPFKKRPKAKPVKRSNLATRCNIEKLSKPRKVNVGYHPGFQKQNWLAKAKEAETITQAPTFTQQAAMVVVPTQLAASSVTFIQPGIDSAASAQPTVTSLNQSQMSPWYCAICMYTRKWCPTKCPMPLKSDWSNLEEEKHTTEQNKEEETEYWDSDLQKKKKELEEQELKNNKKDPQSSPEFTSTTEIEMEIWSV